MENKDLNLVTQRIFGRVNSDTKSGESQEEETDTLDESNDDNEEEKIDETDESNNQEESETKSEESKADKKQDKVDAGKKKEDAGEEKDYKKLYEDAEIKRRGFQSAASLAANKESRMQRELDDLKAQVANLKNQPQFEELEGNDNELLTKKEAKAVLKKALAPSNQKSSRSGELTDEDLKRFEAWAKSQPDVEDVDKFVRENQDVIQPLIQSTVTDVYGKYYAALALTKESQLSKVKAEKEKLEADIKTISRKGNRTTMPITGSGGSIPGVRKKSNKELSSTARYFGR